jgi:hypothetical protein
LCDTFGKALASGTSIVGGEFSVAGISCVNDTDRGSVPIKGNPASNTEVTIKATDACLAVTEPRIDDTPSTPLKK